MSKCKKCGTETNLMFCPNCGAIIVPTVQADGEPLPSTEDNALEKKIKHDWYYKTWQSENPKHGKIIACCKAVGWTLGLTWIILIAIAGFKLLDIDKTLRGYDPRLLLDSYNDVVKSLYTLFVTSAFCYAASNIAEPLIAQWTGTKLVQWQGSLQIDGERIATDIISNGKSNNLYNDAVDYMYYRLQNKKPPYKLTEKVVMVGSWKGVIIECILSFCMAAVIAVGGCLLVKSGAEKALKSILGEVPPSISSSGLTTGIDPTTATIIFIVSLVILIAAILIISNITYKASLNKKVALVETYIRNNSSTSENK